VSISLLPNVRHDRPPDGAAKLSQLGTCLHVRPKRALCWRLTPARGSPSFPSCLCLAAFSGKELFDAPRFLSRYLFPRRTSYRRPARIILLNRPQACSDDQVEQLVGWTFSTHGAAEALSVNRHAQTTRKIGLQTGFHRSPWLRGSVRDFLFLIGRCLAVPIAGITDKGDPIAGIGGDRRQNCRLSK